MCKDQIQQFSPRNLLQHKNSQKLYVRWKLSDSTKGVLKTTSYFSVLRRTLRDPIHINKQTNRSQKTENWKKIDLLRRNKTHKDTDEDGKRARERSKMKRKRARGLRVFRFSYRHNLCSLRWLSSRRREDGRTFIERGEGCRKTIFTLASSPSLMKWQLRILCTCHVYRHPMRHATAAHGGTTCLMPRWGHSWAAL